MVVCGFNIDDVNDIVLLNIFRFFGKPGLKAFARNTGEPKVQAIFDFFFGSELEGALAGKKCCT